VDRDHVGAEPLAHHFDAHLEVGAHPVHFVHEDDARHVVAIGLAPHGLGLRLDAAHRVEHRDGAVEDPQGALHLDGEVHVPGVSMMLIRCCWPRRGQKAVVAADVMVMPRSCSCSIQSIVAVPSCTSPSLYVRPV